MPADFYTFVKDLRPFGHGTPVAYKYVASAFVSDAQGEIAQGEFCAYDSTNQRVTRFARNGGNGVFIGVSRDSAVSMRKLGNQAALALTELSVFTSGVHEFLGLTGDSYVHGDAVYMEATSTIQITKTAGVGGVQIGQVFLPDGTTKTGQVRVPVLIDAYTNLAD
jgi:hypothetical protein